MNVKFVRLSFLVIHYTYNEEKQSWRYIFMCMLAIVTRVCYEWKKNRTIVTLVDFVLCLVLCKACIGNGDLSLCDCCVGSRDIIWRETRDEKKAETKARIVILFARSCINITLIRRIVGSLPFEGVSEWRIVRRWALWTKQAFVGLYSSAARSAVIQSGRLQDLLLPFHGGVLRWRWWKASLKPHCFAEQ
jgi:hypothetical protein